MFREPGFRGKIFLVTFVDLCGLGLRLESRKWVNTSVDYCNQQLEKGITEDLKTVD
jgi:regulation of enolase protein 1 (concanavalin A-like superfamily)